MKIKTLTHAWNNFFFSPVSPAPLGLFRILLGIIVLQDLLLMILPDWKSYYGDNPLIPIDQMAIYYWHQDPVFDLMLFLPDENWRFAFFILMIVLTVFMTIGLFTRFVTVTLFFCLLSFDYHFQLNQNDGDVFIRLAVMFTSMSNAGYAFSVDNLIRAMRQDWRVTGLGLPLMSPWAQRLLQMEQAFVYWHTFACKISGANWVQGTAVYYASRYDEMFRFPLPYLFENLLICKLLTWGTLAIEFSLFTLVWFKETCYWVLLAGVLLHLGIDYSTNLPMFEWMFIFTYILFVQPEDLTRFMDLIKARVERYYGPPHIVSYDGDCIICVRTVGLIHRLDVFGRFDLRNFRDQGNLALFDGVSNDRLESEIMLKTTKGWLSGFDAFRYMTGRMPLLMVLFPLLYLPGIALVGKRVYSSVAKNRFKILGGDCKGPFCETSVASKA